MVFVRHVVIVIGAIVIRGAVLIICMSQTWVVGFANSAGVTMLWRKILFVDVGVVIVVGVIVRLSGRIVKAVAVIGGQAVYRKVMERELRMDIGAE